MNRMIHCRYLHWLLLPLLMGFLALQGCVRNSEPDRFYLLQPLEELKSLSLETGLLIGVGPVRIPAYLDRPQIVTAVSGQAYGLSERHRWAERLDVNVTRTTMLNLAALMPSAQLLQYPWPREPKPDVQAVITLQEMVVDAGGEAHFDALWTLRYGDHQIVSRRFMCRKPASTEDYGVMVQAYSQCLARLNREMATAIGDLARP